MLTSYSSSYKMGETTIETISDIQTQKESKTVISLPRISTDQYLIIDKWYSENGLSNKDPVIKVGSSHFSVVEGNDLARDTLKVPHNVISEDTSAPHRGKFFVLDPSSYEWFSSMMNPKNIVDTPF